ncbi:MAG TPA: histidine kinase, partial [Verrucomicrobiales bacterium]|nr:histidine kinase [Verrucomicrobiales bacterium]
MKQLTADAILYSVHGLPALPAVVLELIQSFSDSDVSAEQLAIKISHDQAIAAKTLRLANSSFYGLPRQVTSITEATAILG